MAKQATEIADDLLCFVAFIEREGLPPTVREFQHEVGLTSTSVAQYHLTRLGSHGYLERRNHDGDSRSWRLTDAGRKAVEETA